MRKSGRTNGHGAFFTRRLDREGGGVQAETLESAVGLQERRRAPGSIASIPHNGMPGQFGVATYLVLAAGQQLALHHGVMGARGQDPIPGQAGFFRALPPRVAAAAGALCQRPFPEAPIVRSARRRNLAVHDGGVPFGRGAGLELGGEVAERLGIMGQQNDAAGVPVQPMNGMKADLGGDPDAVTEFRGRGDPVGEEGAKVFPRFVVNAQALRFFHDQPSFAADNDGDFDFSGGFFFI